MTLFKTLIFSVILLAEFQVLALSPSARGQTIQPTDLANHIQFRYMTSDGGFQLSCNHYPNFQINTDFDVYCGKGTPTFKEYLVHLIIRTLTSNQAPETTYEILYWVTDRSSGLKPAFSSTSQLFTLDQSTRLKKLSLSQSLENDAAQLYLDYLP